MKWWNNGKQNKRGLECPGEGWESGRLTFKRKPHSTEHRKHLSESLKGKSAWNKGKKNVYSDETRRKMSNSAKRRAARGIMPDNTGKPAWNRTEDISAFKRFQRDVRALSEKNYRRNKAIVNPENHKRGKYTYHLDHIISIKHGFENGLTCEEVAATENLRVIHWRENLSKGSEVEWK